MTNIEMPESKKSLDTPVLFLVFNRIDTVKQVFASIRQARPPRLYIASDGARESVTGEQKKVDSVRDYIASNIDWECDVKTLYRNNNLGCKKAVSSAITWFFSNEEMGIILEDDCLPSQSFYWYCEELLEKYKDNKQIMHIAGMTYVEHPSDMNNYSYHFVRVGGIWGWASWKRAWDLYELEMESYPQAKEENIFDDLFVGESAIKKTYINWFDQAYGNTHTWDFQWTYTKIINNSINIMPAVNLVKNIGHGTLDATHTLSDDGVYSKMALKNLDFPLKHPRFIVVDRLFNDMNFRFNVRRTFKSLFYHSIEFLFPKFLVKHLKILKKSFRKSASI